MDLIMYKKSKAYITKFINYNILPYIMADSLKTLKRIFETKKVNPEVFENEINSTKTENLRKMIKKVKIA